MTVVLKQTGSTGSCGTPAGVYCASATLGDSPTNSEVSSSGTDTSTVVADLGNKQADRAEVFIQYDAASANYDGASGNWVVRLDVTVADDMTWEECYVCHLDGGCGGTPTTLASGLFLGISMASTGVKSSGLLNQSGSQTIDSGDIIMIVCVFSYVATGALACTLRVDPTDGISAPGSEAAGEQTASVGIAKTALKGIARAAIHKRSYLTESAVAVFAPASSVLASLTVAVNAAKIAMSAPSANTVLSQKVLVAAPAMVLKAPLIEALHRLTYMTESAIATRAPPYAQINKGRYLATPTITLKAPAVSTGGEQIASTGSAAISLTATALQVNRTTLTSSSAIACVAVAVGLSTARTVAVASPVIAVAAVSVTPVTAGAVATGAAHIALKAPASLQHRTLLSSSAGLSVVAVAVTPSVVGGPQTASVGSPAIAMAAIAGSLSTAVTVTTASAVASLVAPAASVSAVSDQTAAVAIAVMALSAVALTASVAAAARVIRPLTATVTSMVTSATVTSTVTSATVHPR